MTNSVLHTGLTPNIVQQIHTNLDQLESYLHFLIKLTPEERRSLPVVGDRRFSFVSKSYRYAQRHPDLLPPFRNINEFTRVHNDYEALQPILDRINSVREGLSDTVMQIGSNVFDFSLVFYEMTQTAATSGQPGTESIAKDLAKHFARINSGSDDEETEPQGKDGGTINIPAAPEGPGNVAL